jgi:2-keto-3-deoxy-L-fuconate dehydrogenase
MFRLDRKVAIITGGGSGIGRAIAKVFAGQGAWVFVLDMDQEAGNSVVKEILHEKGKAEFRNCDVSDHLKATGVVENIFAQGGSIDILVNNAGIAHIGTAESTSEADFEKLIRVNIKGVYNCIKAAIPHMKKNGGTILNMASAAATVGIPERFGYSMTKGAVLSMTLSVAKDYVNQNIRCNCISPGRVHTPFVDGFIAKNYPGREKEMFEKLSKTQPIGRMAQPEEIAYLALYLCSEEAAFVTGCDYPIDGGFIRLNN